MRQLHRITVLLFLIYHAEAVMFASVLERRRAEVETRLKSPERRDVCLRRVLCLLLQDVRRPAEFQYMAIYQVRQS